MKSALLLLPMLLVIGCAKGSGSVSPALASSPSPQSPAPKAKNEGLENRADPCLSHFAGKWARDMRVMHPQVDLTIEYHPANLELSMSFIPPADSADFSSTQTYVVDGKRHNGNGANTGKSYSASCEKFEIKIVQDSQDSNLVIHTYLGLDMLGLSVWSFANDKSSSFYQRYARTSLDH